MRGGQIVGLERYHPPEVVEGVRATGAGRIIHVPLREARVDENGAVAGADQIAGDRDEPPSLVDLEATVVEDSELEGPIHAAIMPDSHGQALDCDEGAEYLAVEMAETDATYAPPPGQGDLVAALRAGDERAFASLIDELGPSMLRVARMYVSTQAVAEEVVQETWLGVLSGIERFEGRSSLKTWIFRILTNRAKTRGEREGRSVPFSSFGSDGDGEDGPTVDADRFQRSGQHEGAWTSAPSSWSDLPESRLVGKETIELVHAAIAALPESQRTVITLRDVDGWSSEEVRNVLGLSESNQRVLLHRARAKVRQALETYLEGDRS